MLRGNCSRGIHSTARDPIVSYIEFCATSYSQLLIKLEASFHFNPCIQLLVYSHYIGPLARRFTLTQFGT